MSAHALFDAQGPRGRATVRVITVASVLALLGVAALVYWQLYRTGQLAPSKWLTFTEPGTIRYLLTGLGNTALAALGAGAIGLPLGLVLALGRLSRRRWLSWPATAVIEVLRAVPVLLLIYIFMFALPQYGINLSTYGKLVVPIGLGAAAVMAEVFRAGVLAVPRGQTEAGLAVGLPDGVTMRLVVFPQALRIVIPALVAQAVVVVKDTAFGYVVSYPELMQSGRVLVANTNDLVQTYLVITVVYVLVNMVISALAQRMEARMNASRGLGRISLLGRARRSTLA
ncbi:amino acid ABC transporter permease [Serinibacter salmoneus]|uniref:Glutamate transport system permease protein n=1 Tax=Serinibacter salmoneus TaxID=556530 RepID=A0A2A9D4I7_9MICO|nr:amino acid ABC transporter permease [Serinibacter salmoneus]PFG20770.1 glutamate transport system permease protein [Serinibacter salmoneus]